MADGYLNFDTRVDTKGFNKGTKTISQSLNSLTSLCGKFAAALGVAFSIGALVNFGKQAISIASDVQEVQNVVDTAFGEMAYKMEAFADTAIESFGISKLSAKQTGSTLMAMAKGMGIAQDYASDMAVTLTGLSADMASFYNVTQDVASTALKSIFTGETETLKQFGVVMTEANLQAFALSQGITKNVSAMTQAEKVQLRYAYVMEQTALAQGDFAKTSNSWANQTRILSEQWKEFSATVGTVLVNVLTPAVKTLNSILAQLIVSTKNAAAVLSDIFGFDMSQNIGTSSLATDTNIAADNYNDIASSAEDAAKAAERQLMGIDEINKLSDDSGSSGTDLGDLTTTPVNYDATPATEGAEETSKALGVIKQAFEVLGGFVSTNFGPVFTGIWDNFAGETIELKTNLQTVFGDIQTLAEPLKSYFGNNLVPYLKTKFAILGGIGWGLFDTFNQVFSDIWNIAAFPMLNNFVTVGLPLMTDFSTRVWQSLSNLFFKIKGIFDTLWVDVAQPILSGIKTVWNDLWNSMQTAWNKWGDPIFDNIDKAISNWKETFDVAWTTTIKPIWDELCLAADDIWNNHLKPLVDNFLDFVGEFVNGALTIYNEFISPIVQWFHRTFGPAISKVFKGVISHVKNTIADIVDFANGIITALKGVVKFLVGIFTGNWEKAWEGIKEIFGGIWDSLVALVRTPINQIIDLVNGLIGSIEDGLNGIVEKINTLSFDIPDWDVFGDMAGETFGMNLDTISIPRIPQLATGTVVPANFGEFAAILGDNKREPEIVSPYSTMVQAFKDALSDMQGGRTEIIKLILDGKTLQEIIRKYSARNTRATNGGAT